MRIMRMFSIMIMLATFRIIPSQDERVSCCSSSSQIRQIKLLTQGIKNSINAINDTVSEFECTPAEITSILDNIAEMSSALDTITNIGVSSCCSEVDQIESFVTAIESKIESLQIDCCDLITQSVAIASTFDSLIDNIQSGPTCCSLVDRMLSSLESLESIVEEVDALVQCATIPIFTSTTISVSGSYCLANPLNPGFIVITAGNVTLNLNGNAVIMDNSSGLFLDVPIGIRVAGPGNVVIKNGFIDAQSVTGAVAMLIAASHVIVKDVQVLGNFTSEAQPQNSLVDGIIVEGVSAIDTLFPIHDIFIDRVTVDRCVFGIGTLLASNCNITNSNFNGNQFVGAELVISPFNRVENCIFNGNEIGFLISGETSLGTGGNNLVLNSSAQGNRIGFGVNLITETSIGNALIDCVAQSNSAIDTIGIDGAGFVVFSDEEHLQLIKRCIATGNNIGFVNSSCSVIEYIANVAQDNTTNYDDPTNPTYNTPVNPIVVDPASYWLNLTI